MSVGETYSEPTLLAAEKVAAILARAGIDSVLIGAAALAVHGYPRATQDLDLATCVEPKRLAAVVPDLRREGFSAEMTLPGLKIGGNVVTLAAQMSAGRNHRCVVLHDATLRCWGTINAHGQLGYGHSNAVVPPQAGPVPF